MWGEGGGRRDLFGRGMIADARVRAGIKNNCFGGRWVGGVYTYLRYE